MKGTAFFLTLFETCMIDSLPSTCCSTSSSCPGVPVTNAHTQTSKQQTSTLSDEKKDGNTEAFDYPDCMQLAPTAYHHIGTGLPLLRLTSLEDDCVECVRVPFDDGAEDECWLPCVRSAPHCVGALRQLPLGVTHGQDGCRRREWGHRRERRCQHPCVRACVRAGKGYVGGGALLQAPDSAG